MAGVPNTPATVDITPQPRLLWALGEIPFEPWQALAELIDNALDAFQDAQRTGVPVDSPRIDIDWSRVDDSSEKEIVLQDNGNGMTLDAVQDAVSAGYTSNNPVDNLGLFGMGFNIATANLGDETIFWSTQAGQTKWLGVRIDFDELIRGGNFQAPVETAQKDDPNKSGTKVVIKKLKPGVLEELANTQKIRILRERLGRVYSCVLEQGNVEIRIKGTQLAPRRHCIWSKDRKGSHRQQTEISAYQVIDRDLGDAWFNVDSNRYLTEAESIEVEGMQGAGKALPPSIEKRSRRMKGWLGLQRHLHMTEYGVDFIRNGRKILLFDKGVFSYENPFTGAAAPEYPAELNQGGRIVGEVHVDYLIPTYQKNEFEQKSGHAWALTIDAIRGAGPMLEKQRKALGFDKYNYSPLGLLFNAFRRSDKGTRYLSVPSAKAEEFYKKFCRNDPDYGTDEKWYQVAKEMDKSAGTPPVHGGTTPSMDPGTLGPGSVAPPGDAPPSSSDPSSQSSQRDTLIQGANKMELLTGEYSYSGAGSMSVTAYDTEGGMIWTNGNRVPTLIFQDGVQVDFFFDRTHPLLAEYPLTEKQLLLTALSEKFSIRDPVGAMEVFYGLAENHMNDERIHATSLSEKARLLLNSIREKLPDLLVNQQANAITVIKDNATEKEQLWESLLSDAPDLLQEIQDESDRAHEAFAYVPHRTIARLIKAFPEELLDGKALKQPYTSIDLGDEDATRRLRDQSVDDIVSYIRDMCALITSAGLSKHELVRHMNTLTLLGDRVP